MAERRARPPHAPAGSVSQLRLRPSRLAGAGEATAGALPRIWSRGVAVSDAAAVLLCPQCGYDLQGIDSARCPECGELLDREHLARSRIPWVSRGEIGRAAAYVRTVWQV